ncbi:hypothetical protein [Hyphomicrobium sp.]|uniref:hypothetical protein n=1 Tax=Hyphomicrobium sp. TaxID=82 RepID=UPI0025C07011|nr:hypothetical protein [Hyphomicrobium sp.]MCC7252836.1 hypothetical protein [Hyphomicrobium sp.]
MERDYGAELVSMFGARLKRIYESEEQRLPAQIAACLERLHRAEQQRAAGTASPPQDADASDVVQSFFMDAPATR